MGHGAEVALAVERIVVRVELLPEPRPTINYILGGLIDDQYQSKHQMKRLLRAATVQARVNIIHVLNSSRAIQLIDDPISFPPYEPVKGHNSTPLCTLYLLYVLTILMCIEY